MHAQVPQGESKRKSKVHRPSKDGQSIPYSRSVELAYWRAPKLSSPCICRYSKLRKVDDMDLVLCPVLVRSDFVRRSSPYSRAIWTDWTARVCPISSTATILENTLLFVALQRCLDCTLAPSTEDLKASPEAHARHRDFGCSLHLSFCLVPFLNYRQILTVYREYVDQRQKRACRGHWSW